MSEEVQTNVMPDRIVKKELQVQRLIVIPEVNIALETIRIQGKGFHTQVQIETSIKLAREEYKIITQTDQEQIILNHKKAVVITNDQHLRDRHLLPDLIPGPPDLPAGQVVGPEVLQEALFQDHPDHPERDNYLNSNTIL